MFCDLSMITETLVKLIILERLYFSKLPKTVYRPIILSIHGGINMKLQSILGSIIFATTCQVGMELLQEEISQSGRVVPMVPLKRAMTLNHGNNFANQIKSMSSVHID